MGKLPLRIAGIESIIINPQPFRVVDEERGFVIVSRTDNDRPVELHLTEHEVRKLVGDGAIFLSKRPIRTTIYNYKVEERNGT